VSEAPDAFAAPWEAQAFALTVSLHERGAFTWPEWTAALAREIERAPHDEYYRQWLAALERLVAGKGLASAEELARCREAVRAAAAHTTHG
jgi:nitrile hydratase accessory protein